MIKMATRTNLAPPISVLKGFTTREKPVEARESYRNHPADDRHIQQFTATLSRRCAVVID